MKSSKSLCLFSLTCALRYRERFYLKRRPLTRRSLYNHRFTFVWYDYLETETLVMNDREVKSPLVSCNWLQDNLDNPRIAILDCSFFLPNQNRYGGEEFLAEHIPGSQFFDIDLIADRNNPLPHMLPTTEEFSTAVGGLGIDNQTKVVVYDNNGYMASARVWWTFRVFGHTNVVVLNGGLKGWKIRTRSVVSKVETPHTTRFAAQFNDDLVCDLDGMKNFVATGSHRIVDARSSARFLGREPEIRPGLRSGHIPGSVNLHYRKLANQGTGEFAGVQELDRLFSRLGARKPMVTTCGSGVTASILALGLFCLGIEEIPVYDGSWTEWGGQPDTPAET